MRMIALLVAILAQAGCLFADDGSARRYAAFETNSLVCQYYLLSTKPVQTRLKLTQQQIKSLKAFMRTSLDDSVPGWVEHRRSQAEKRRAAGTEQEQIQINKEGRDKCYVLWNQALLATLRNTLTPTQAVILNGLLLQMRGPHAMLEATNLVQQLGLSEAQTVQLREVSEEYRELIAPLQRRRAHLELNTLRPRNSRAELYSEIERLIQVIKDMERDQDYELLMILSAEQRRLWEDRCGKRVSINWEPESLFDVPFGDP